MADYPDFTVIARLKGEYAGAEKAVALDVDGALQTLLYGTYSGANKKILTDVDGNVRMNLYAQDLDEMINRFKYGAPDDVFSYTPYNTGEWTEFVSITGKGQIYSCVSHFETSISQAALKYRLIVDDNVFPDMTLGNMSNWNMFRPEDHYIYLREYDNVFFRYRTCFAPGWSFETNYKVWIYPDGVIEPNVYTDVSYSLI